MADGKIARGLERTIAATEQDADAVADALATIRSRRVSRLTSAICTSRGAVPTLSGPLTMKSPAGRPRAIQIASESACTVTMSARPLRSRSATAIADGWGAIATSMRGAKGSGSRPLRRLEASRAQGA